MLLTAGERISIALLSMAINDLGRDAVSFTGSQAGIVTDASHGKAKIVEMRTDRVRKRDRSILYRFNISYSSLRCFPDCSAARLMFPPTLCSRVSRYFLVQRSLASRR